MLKERERERISNEMLRGGVGWQMWEGEKLYSYPVNLINILCPLVLYCIVSREFDGIKLRGGHVVIRE